MSSPDAGGSTPANPPESGNTQEPNPRAPQFEQSAPPVYGDVPRYGYQQSAPTGPPASFPSSGAPAGSYPPPAGAPQLPDGPWSAASAPYPTGTWPSPAYAPTAAWPTPNYASWGRRVGANLIDTAPALVATAVLEIGYFQWLMAYSRAASTSTALPSRGVTLMIVGGVLTLAALGWQIYNRWIVGGRTGQSLGKRVLKISLLAEDTGRPIGALNAFARDLVHVVDGIAYVGYLWPLWDPKRQTFADKLMRTIVVAAEPPAPPSVTTGGDQPAEHRT